MSTEQTVTSIVDAITPIANALLPGSGTAIAIGETVAKAAIPGVIAAYEYIVSLHAAQAPDVPIAEWAAQFSADALRDPNAILDEAEKA